MNSSDLKGLSAQIAQAGAPGLPTIILATELPVFEVEFAALEFAVEAKLAASDWAVLALARALGEVTPADVDAYLGLGEAVSECLIRRLLDEALLQERGPRSEAAPTAEETWLESWFRRLLGTKAPESPRPAGRVPTSARRLYDSRAATTPVCILGAAGMQALERGAVAQRRTRAARLVFTASPLLYLQTVNEKQHRFSQHRRPHPLDPQQVPESLRLLDVALGLPPAERLGACGIDTGVRGFPGQLVGIEPGAQWEVRPVIYGNREPAKALLILAGFTSSEVGGLRWRAYLRQQDQVQDLPHLDAARLMDPSLLSLPSLVQTVSRDGADIPPASALRADGAFEVRCGEATLAQRLGEADRPDDTFLPAVAPGFNVAGLRVHALPADGAAARSAFYEFLSRHDADLRRDFDGTCASVTARLLGYWSENHPLPSADAAAGHLWTRPELRAALCMRRLRADLVDAYVGGAPQ